MESVKEEGLKFDSEKLDWSAIPLEILEPLVAVFVAGAKKYGYLNCLRPFENGDRRFFAAAMRHSVGCQLDPLAMDPETGCYEAAEAAWNHLVRLYHARKKAIGPTVIDGSYIADSTIRDSQVREMPLTHLGFSNHIMTGTVDIPPEERIFADRVEVRDSQGNVVWGKL